jgi:hypothetical protein
MSPVVPVLALVFGVLGYREAARYNAATGKDPWGVPAIAWAAICAFSALLGALFLYAGTKDNRSAENGDGALLTTVVAGILGLFALFFAFLAIAGLTSGSIGGALVCLLLGGASGWGARGVVRWHRRSADDSPTKGRSTLDLRV